jgi:DNA-binding winged helix-turn-helix (wHTH) protein
MVRSPGMRIRFGPFELDDERLQLTREGLAVALRPKVFDLLLVLVRERARVVRREELFERLWSSTAVGGGSLSGLVNELRVALGESGRGPSSIRTVHARGYQFVAPATELESVGRTAEPERASAESLRAAPESDSGSEAVVATSIERVSIERLRMAREDLAGTGARALVACLRAEFERSTWLASRTGEAMAAGFQVRFMAARSEGRDAAPGSGMSASEARGRGGAARTFGPLSSARGLRLPIALVLDVEDLGSWHRAGGLRRLLDLLGNAPVLVIAALAAGPDEPVARALLDGDERVERDPIGAVRPSFEVAGDGGGPAEQAAAIACALQGIARASGPLFEPALRSLGFESVRPEPIRNLRRVGPGVERFDAAGPAEAVGAEGARAGFERRPARHGRNAGPTEPGVRSRGP